MKKPLAFLTVLLGMAPAAYAQSPFTGAWRLDEAATLQCIQKRDPGFRVTPESLKNLEELTILFDEEERKLTFTHPERGTESIHYTLRKKRISISLCWKKMER